jgi:hypothetical protein
LFRFGSSEEKMTMRIAVRVNPWSARVLFVLCLVLSFLLPYTVGVLFENALIRHWEGYGFTPGETLLWWENGVVSLDMAKQWRVEGFAAPDARPWIAMNISAGEAREWRDAGAALSDAAEWRRYAFTPSRAGAWMRREFSMGDAIAWRKHGFEAEDAAVWREKGVSPAMAGQAKRGGRQ